VRSQTFARLMLFWLKAGETPLRTAFQCALVCLLENMVGSLARLFICCRTHRQLVTSCSASA